MINIIQDTISTFNQKNGTIEFIVQNGLCNYCGVCKLVCPYDAIEYEDCYISTNEKCTKCGKCLIFCSQNQELRYTTDMYNRENNSKIAKTYPNFKKIHFGKFSEIYNCRTNLQEVQEEAMVGGATTSVLLFAIHHKIADVAVSIDFTPGKQFPVSKISTSDEDVIKTAGSKYLPSLALEILEDIYKNEEIKSIILTTLPCQAYAIEKLRRDKHLSYLTQKVRYVITLFCGSGLPSRKDVELFLKKKKIQENLREMNVSKLMQKKWWRINPQSEQRYIYEGKNGEKHSFSSHSLLACKEENNCGNICPDYTGIFSDISIGASNLSMNIVVSRTEKGDKLIKEAMNNNYLKETTDFSKVSRFLIKIMGKKKREKIREEYQEIHIKKGIN